jgi:hypothetical protein
MEPDHGQHDNKDGMTMGAATIAFPNFNCEALDGTLVIQVGELRKEW